MQYEQTLKQTNKFRKGKTYAIEAKRNKKRRQSTGAYMNLSYLD